MTPMPAVNFEFTKCRRLFPRGKGNNSEKKNVGGKRRDKAGK